jgi:hypothetical protein
LGAILCSTRFSQKALQAFSQASGDAEPFAVPEACWAAAPDKPKKIRTTPTERTYRILKPPLIRSLVLTHIADPLAMPGRGAPLPLGQMSTAYMINPTPSDMGREVVHYQKHGDDLMPAYGWITSVTNKVVLVSFGGDSIPIPHEELEWGYSENPRIAVEDEQVRDDQTLDLFAVDSLAGHLIGPDARPGVGRRTRWHLMTRSFILAASVARPRFWRLCEQRRSRSPVHRAGCLRARRRSRHVSGFLTSGAGGTSRSVRCTAL